MLSQITTRKPFKGAVVTAIRRTRFEDSHDVGMVDRSGDFGFAFQLSRDERIGIEPVENFERDILLGNAMASLVNRAERTATNFPFDPVKSHSARLAGIDRSPGRWRIELEQPWRSRFLQHFVNRIAARVASIQVRCQPVFMLGMSFDHKATEISGQRALRWMHPC